MSQEIFVEIAVAKSRFSKKWRMERWSWEKFCAKCSTKNATPETMAEYKAMSDDMRSNIKDVGGFVACHLAGGRRQKSAVLDCTMVCLDIDKADDSLFDEISVNWPWEAMLYTTHKHTHERNRFRLMMPVNRPMSREEYEAVERWVAEKAGIDAVDHTCYELGRLFYWPSSSVDGPFEAARVSGRVLDVDEVLGSYQDWRDVSQWPVGAGENELVAREVKMAADPLTKKGPVGVFCRTYSVSEAIAKFIPDAYVPTSQADRYTYAKGHVAGGLVVYDDKLAYSHHDTDPASRMCCNAFDLVRVHRFGEADGGKAYADVTKSPSYKAMIEMVQEDEESTATAVAERVRESLTDFDDFGSEPSGEEKVAAGKDNGDAGKNEEKPEWYKKFKVDKNEKPLKCNANLELIALCDDEFKKVRYDEFSQCDVIVEQPCAFTGTHGDWMVDDNALSSMAAYVSRRHFDVSKNEVAEKMLEATARRRGFNPVKEFISSVEWDGVPRLEELFIKYLGAKDLPEVREATKVWAVAAVARVFEMDNVAQAGIKFDYCPVLQGPQGIGKSVLIGLLAGRWYGSASLSATMKELCEIFVKSWIVEFAEFRGLKNAEVETIKDLISRPSDDFRAAYARKHIRNPRHCVTIASCNEEYFLKDATGNRRFWTIHVEGAAPVYLWRDGLAALVPQIWAEARHIYLAEYSGGRKPLMLSPQNDARMMQSNKEYATVMGDPLRDYLAWWLDIPVPSDWKNYNFTRRSIYYSNYDPEEPLCSAESKRVEQISIVEIQQTCGYKGIQNYSSKTIGAVLLSLGWERGTRVRIETDFCDSSPRKNESQCVTNTTFQSQKQVRTFVRPKWQMEDEEEDL